MGRLAAPTLAVALWALAPRASADEAPAERPAARAREHLDAAERALAAADPGAAEAALALTWLYVGSPAFAAAWRAGGPEGGEARAALAGEHEALAARLVAARRLPLVARRRDGARAAIDAAYARRRPDPGAFQAAAAEARACVEAAEAPGADVEWAAPPGGVSLAGVRDECAAISRAAEVGLERATAEAAARDQAFRAILRGDRATIYAELGEPRCDCGDSPQEVARARVWIYVRGPLGALRTYETLTFTFRGDALVSRRQRVAHERP